jgi:SAM-dependent methyltransferase
MSDGTSGGDCHDCSRIVSGMPFGPGYASAYDVLYGDKEYEAEVDILEALFARHASCAVHSVLDLGCGTGSHALPLAHRSYAVTGVDVSPDMLARGRSKLSNTEVEVELREGDIRSYRDGREYDAVIMMFAVLGYQRSNVDVLAALSTVAAHLRPGGVFVADFWYGPAVLSSGPGSRRKTVMDGSRRVLRFASSVCDESQHTCVVTYDVLTTEGARVVSEVHEEHEMRFFFPLELDFALAEAGLCRSALTAYPDVERPASAADWCACLVAGRAPGLSASG